ncbi:trichohyalin [Colossoma macropomum]|uniref:trichohyalin n=1 Tax=Colossoma macropomum TaxID=42526 RepID=UPI001863DD6B|nr:trichohyalin [Colossoma macropomum]
METQSENPFNAGAKQHAAAKAADSTHQGNSPLPELRLVLLGRKGTGKSSAGNTILGLSGGFETGKPTEECVKRRADTAGHRVTVVDTPGWEWYYSSNGTPGWVQRETMRSVSLCPPGPHALLLVVRSCASVTEDYYRQIEVHLELLGKTVWGHTMVLFTRGDELSSIPIEQRIQNGGKSFQKLLQRCGNRFHVLENKRRGDDGTQVMELMRKIEEMVKERGGKHYDSDPLLLVLEVEGKRRARERRKKQRLMEAQTQRGAIKAVLTVDAPQTEDLDDRSLFSRGSRRLPELRLILLGERETGKSSAGNAILRGVTFFQTGQATEECSRQQAEVSGRLVTVVDAPGWEGGPDGITPERVRREIGVSVTLCPPGPHALLLTLRVDALVRAAAVRDHLELLGEGVWRHTVLLFTRGDQLREGVTIEQHIQGGGKDLHWLMEKCGNRYHVISSVSWEGHSSTAQVTGLLEKIEKMVAGNRCEAFSPLVQEIQDLGKQKNERFNQKLKEVNDKLQRQDTELKRMREREVKSIRWFFDRRKDKVKSPEKTSTEKEEAVDRGEDDRKSIMGELEERMAWLTEDKEREIQELSLENSRVIAALNQVYREKDELVMKLEEKENEGDELKEKVDELQVKVLELERVSMLKEQERQEKEEELTKRHESVEKEVNVLKEELDQKEKEEEGLKRRVEETEQKMAQSKLRYEDEIIQAKHETHQILSAKNEFEKRLVENQKEMEEIKLQAENKIKEQEERWRELSEKREREMNKLREMLELMTKEMEELQVAFQEQVKTSEAERQMHENTVIKYNELVDKLLGKDAEIVAIQKRQKEQEMAQSIETQAKLQEKDAEINDLTKRHKEKEQEIDVLKQAVDAKQKTMEILKNDSQAKIVEFTSRIKLLEDEYKEMEDFLKRENAIIKEEMEIMKKLYEDNMRKKEDDTRQILEMKENMINQLQKQNKNREAHLEDLIEQLRESQIHEGSLQNQNEALMQESEGLLLKCEDYKRDLQAQRAESQRKEKEIKDILNQYEEMGKIKDALSQEHIEEKEKEICLLKQTNHTQQMDLEDMKERAKELKNKIEEMKKYYEERLLERIAEMDVKDAERERALHSRELELSEREHTLRQNMQELERSKKDLKKQEDDISWREQGLRDEKQVLDKREHEVRDKEKKLEHQCQNNQRYQEDLERRENELQKREEELLDAEQKLEQEIKKKHEEHKAVEMILESKQKAQKDLSEKQEKEIENIRQQLEDRGKELRKMEEELVLKQLNLKEEKKALENHRENVETKEQGLKKRQQQLIDSENVYENKLQELYRGMQELEKTKQDHEKWQAELTNKEYDLTQRLNELQKKEQELREREHELGLITQELMVKSQEIETREQNQATLSDKWKKELEAIELDLSMKEQELINAKEELERRQQELADRDKDLDIKEHQINKKYDEYEVAEKMLESKEKAQIISLEKQEKDIEIVRQQLEEREKELKNMEEELLVKQIKHKEDLENHTANLDIKESEMSKREQQLMDSEQICEVKAQELSNALQELQNNKQENEKWQAELTAKECDLIQRLNELEKKEHQLLQRENDNAVKETNQEIEKHQQQLLSLQHIQATDKLEKELEGVKQALAIREQEVTNKEDELQKREDNLKSAEIYLGQREEIVQKREEEVQINKQQQDAMLCDLKKKQEKTEEIASSLETKQHELEDLQKELINREQNIATKEQNLSNTYKELDIRKSTMENHELDLKSTENTLKNREQELNELKEILEMKKEDLANCTNELENQKQELNHEKQVVKVKTEELEKWEKYLYNTELKMINSNSNFKFQPWSQTTAPNGNQQVTQKMYQEVGVDGRTCEKELREYGNEDGEDDQSVQMASPSKMTNCEPENAQLAFQHRSKGELEAKTGKEGNGMSWWEEESDAKEEEGEEFFEPASSDHSMTQGSHSVPQELRVVLLGETRSSRRSVRHIILGQYTEIGSPWTGSVSGKPLVVVEPQGIKWRSPKAMNVAFEKELMQNVSLCSPGPHAFILILPAYLSFTGQYRRAVERTMAMLGEASWKHAIVLFTWGEALGESGQQHIKRNGDLEWLIKKCGGRYHILDNRHREAHVVELLEKISRMVAGNPKHYYQTE